VSNNVPLDPENVRVGAIIRGLRNAKGISARDLGIAVRCSESLITAIERGQRRAVPDVRQRIADHLGIPPSDLGDLTSDVDEAVSRVRQAFEYQAAVTEPAA
jgi:transcriptional regulator with XRE-family HTH domain